MKPHRPSTTATVACFWRALAHLGATSWPVLQDPIAAQLLPAGWPQWVYRHIQSRVEGPNPHIRKRLSRWVDLVALREAVLDRLIQEATTLRQLVILGAGYDTRAWRMEALRGVRVFEVDHPATQEEKRRRTAALPSPISPPTWVPVDFARDDLGSALQAAGHQAQVPTVWLSVAVIPYLDDAALRGSLGDMARRSAPGSTALLHYHEPRGDRSRSELRLLLMGWFHEPQIGLRTRETLAREVEAAELVVRRDLGSREQADLLGVTEPANPLIRWSRILVAGR